MSDFVADTSTLTEGELETIITMVSSEGTKVNQGVTPLSRTPTPGADLLRQKMKTRLPIKGEYEVDVKGNRDRELQGISGRDRLTYQSQETVTKLRFKSGSVHDGDEYVHDQLKKAGIQVNKAEAVRGVVRPWNEIPEGLRNTALNLVKEKLDDFRANWRLKLAMALWAANAADPKKWAGIDALLPTTSNSTGLIGTKSRSNVLLRHYLKGSIAAADIEKEIDLALQACNMYNADGSAIDIAVCGETAMNTLKANYYASASSLVHRNTDIEAALKRINIGIPDDCFMLQNPNLLLIMDPTFTELQKVESAAVDWRKRIVLLNSKHLWPFAAPGMDGTEVIKPMPYDQDITYMSKYGEYSIVCDKPNCQAVLSIT